MSFKSFIKSIGQAVNAADSLIPVYGPIIHAFTSTIPGDTDARVSHAVSVVQDKLDLMTHVVVDAQIARESIGISGVQAASMTAPKLAQLFLDIELVRGKKPKDAAKFKEDSAKLGGILNDLLANFEA